MIYAVKHLNPPRAVTVHDHPEPPPPPVPLLSDEEALVRVIRDEYPDWEPTMPGLRDTCPAWCARCDRPYRLRFGPGGELCPYCLIAQEEDQQAGHDHRLRS